MNGFSVEGEAAVGKSNTAGNDTGFVYFWHLAYEHRFMPVKDRSSIGFEFHVCNNRFPYELKSGYFDYGGIDGMCGNPKGTLKRDFAFAGITLRQKITSFGGMPLYGILQGKIGIQDSYNPFFDSGKPNGKFFYEAEKPEAGFGIYLAFKTLFSTIVAGYSMNTQGKWCITLGLK